ncbi:hypothetical protein [Rhodohalobacter barkolensis]|uniref:Uncharacterized protein n=1 Tax=Rhodohalobacter barkolensis TaxID=2053187 RepID=A0A2N0VLW5_9BACT|nr:hypothetical protein [Rhodohalobacter barkolensis]PKD45172.1 hypothetical protein CWD77_06895 [Rhodohalobacter barkolensis]
MKTFALIFKKTGLYLIFGLLFAHLIQSTAWAQVNNINVGDRVRISAPAAQTKTLYRKTLFGTVNNITPEEIYLLSNNEYFIIPFNSIRRIHVSTGKKRNTGKGALIGLSSGALLGGMISLVTYEECDDSEPFGCWLDFSKGESFVLGAAALGLSGLVLGTVLGAIIKTDRWHRLPIEVLMNSPPVTSQKLSFCPVVNVKFSISRNR